MKRLTMKRGTRKFKTHLGWWAEDIKDAITGRRDPLIPPRRLDHNHGFAGGDDIVMMLREHVGLKPSDRVLDIGCGLGRVAKPLASYLSSDGSYVGMDIVKPAVEWMKRAYGPRHQNFEFHHLDIHNSAYNPNGKQSADTVEFPFPGKEQFDIVFLISVFTHMYPQHIKHYLKLIEQQLKSGGCLFASFFINDDFARYQQEKSIEIGNKVTSRVFRQRTDDYYAPGKTNPEFAAAYDVEQLTRLFVGTALKIESPFLFGSWCGREGSSTFYQDVVIATKMKPSTSMV